jgi:hypothetical protein
MMSVAEIIADVRAAMERLDVETAQAAARAAAYTGPERRKHRREVLGEVPAVVPQLVDTAKETPP